MTLLDDFPVTKRWPATTPDRLQLYSFPTPNGLKIPFALEEMGIEYEAHRVTLADSDVKSPEFLSLSPNNKIPAIIDPNGPGGEPIALFESGAILIYLAEKSGKLIGEGAHKYETIKWLMWQMGGVGPMFGQLGFFAAFAGKDIEDPRPRERYLGEAKRLLNVLETHLSDGRDWVTGEFSIADIAIVPWLGTLEFYGVHDAVDWKSHEHIIAYVDRFRARPAIQRGMNMPPREG